LYLPWFLGVYGKTLLRPKEPRQNTAAVVAGISTDRVNAT
jgi:hypothetical protein